MTNTQFQIYRKHGNSVYTEDNTPVIYILPDTKEKTQRTLDQLNDNSLGNEFYMKEAK